MSPAILENTMNVFGGKKNSPMRPNPLWRQQSSEVCKTRGWKCFRRGRASGQLVGGHLVSLINIGYAGYGPEYRGRILFLEGTETGLDFLDKTLNALRLKGVFQQISGLIVGWFDKIEEMSDGHHEYRSHVSFN